jgi:hypothetical protein
MNVTSPPPSASESASRHHRHRALTVAIVLLVGAVGVLGWHAYDQRSEINELRDTVSELPTDEDLYTLREDAGSADRLINDNLVKVGQRLEALRRRVADMEDVVDVSSGSNDTLEEAHDRIDCLDAALYVFINFDEPYPGGC